MSYRNAGRGILLLSLLGCVAGVAQAQLIPPPPVLAPPRAAAPAVPTEELEELDEAKVRATKLWQMRENLVAAEDRFFALYNELNKDDDYDVHCKREAPIGSLIKRRVCRIAFHEKAQAEEAQAMLSGYMAPPANLVLLERTPEYEKTALAVINANPRLRKLIREREEMERKYVAERNRRFKGKWILFE